MEIFHLSSLGVVKTNSSPYKKIKQIFPSISPEHERFNCQFNPPYEFKIYLMNSLLN